MLYTYIQLYIYTCISNLSFEPTVHKDVRKVFSTGARNGVRKGDRQEGARQRRRAGSGASLYRIESLCINRIVFNCIYSLYFSVYMHIFKSIFLEMMYK